jgi:hypothetical protein
LGLVAEERDLILEFEPNEISGTPGGTTTSNLKIKVLPNGAREKQYTFSIYANIILTPTFNLNNSTSANITKFSDFTMTVLPPKDLGDQINEIWDKFGSSEWIWCIISNSARYCRYPWRMAFLKT